MDSRNLQPGQHGRNFDVPSQHSPPPTPFLEQKPWISEEGVLSPPIASSHGSGSIDSFSQSDRPIVGLNISGLHASLFMRPETPSLPQTNSFLPDTPPTTPVNNASSFTDPNSPTFSSASPNLNVNGLDRSLFLIRYLFISPTSRTNLPPKLVSSPSQGLNVNGLGRSLFLIRNLFTSSPCGKSVLATTPCTPPATPVTAAGSFACRKSPTFSSTTPDLNFNGLERSLFLMKTLFHPSTYSSGILATTPSTPDSHWDPYDCNSSHSINSSQLSEDEDDVLFSREPSPIEDDDFDFPSAPTEDSSFLSESSPDIQYGNTAADMTETEAIESDSVQFLQEGAKELLAQVYSVTYDLILAYTKEIEENSASTTDEEYSADLAVPFYSSSRIYEDYRGDKLASSTQDDEGVHESEYDTANQRIRSRKRHRASGDNEEDLSTNTVASGVQGEDEVHDSVSYTKYRPRRCAYCKRMHASRLAAEEGITIEEASPRKRRRASNGDEDEEPTNGVAPGVKDENEAQEVDSNSGDGPPFGVKDENEGQVDSDSDSGDEPESSVQDEEEAYDSENDPEEEYIPLNNMMRPVLQLTTEAIPSPLGIRNLGRSATRSALLSSRFTIHEDSEDEIYPPVNHYYNFLRFGRDNDENDRSHENDDSWRVEMPDDTLYDEDGFRIEDFHL